MKLQNDNDRLKARVRKLSRAKLGNFGHQVNSDSGLV